MTSPAYLPRLSGSGRRTAQEGKTGTGGSSPTPRFPLDPYAGTSRIRFVGIRRGAVERIPAQDDLSRFHRHPVKLAILCIATGSLWRAASEVKPVVWRRSRMGLRGENASWIGGALD